MASPRNRHLPPVPVNQFSMVPRNDVPRSTFRTVHTHKTTFDAGYLVPIHVDEVLPGDVHRGDLTVFCRLATPLFPIMDNLRLETFFFFVPARLVWENWQRFMGEQPTPASSIDFTIPQVATSPGGFPVGSVYDYFGLPTVGQVGGADSVSVNALPLRAYNLIFNEWFRDENLDNSRTVEVDDGPDSNLIYSLERRRKRHDYFTSALPWPLKGGVDVTMPLSGTAPVTNFNTIAGGAPGVWMPNLGTPEWRRLDASGGAGTPVIMSGTAATSANELYADLSEATGATINALRLAVTTQQFLERDARGGTRYTELLRSHFGVTPEDARLQRPEYIGGGVTHVETQAIPQTSEGTATDPLGALGATMSIAGRHEFSYAATEHGYIIGLAHVGADLTYQQGLHKMWSRLTRYDFYWPVFANLGEQAILSKEIYCDGSSGDEDVFGYQERWAEYRHRPSRITGLFRSTSAGTIDPWHLAQDFSSRPVLNSTFMADTPPLSRALAAGASADGQQILFDSVFQIACTRPIPVYSVPGLDRF